MVVNVVDGQGIGTIALDSGNYTAKINFADDNYDISIKNDSFTVFKANVTVIIEVSDEVYGCDVTGNVFASVDGKYAVVIDENKFIVTVKDGVGSFNVGILDAGSYDVVVSFGGTINYNPAKNNTAFEVTRAEPDFNIVVNASEISYGDAVDVGQRLPGDADGSVTYSFENGTVIKVVGVNESFVLSGLDAGSYVICADYSGDVNYAPVSDKITITVFKVSNNMTVNVSDVDYGEDVVINVELPDDATGNVTTAVDGKTYSSQVSDGKADL